VITPTNADAVDGIPDIQGPTKPPLRGVSIININNNNNNNSSGSPSSSNNNQISNNHNNNNNNNNVVSSPSPPSAALQHPELGNLAETQQQNGGPVPTARSSSREPSPLPAQPTSFVVDRAGPSTVSPPADLQVLGQTGGAPSLVTVGQNPTAVTNPAVAVAVAATVAPAQPRRRTTLRKKTAPMSALLFSAGSNRGLNGGHVGPAPTASDDPSARAQRFAAARKRLLKAKLVKKSAETMTETLTTSIPSPAAVKKSNKKKTLSRGSKIPKKQEQHLTNTLSQGEN
jgi:hypothetical protein